MNMNYIKYINDGKLKKVEKGRKKWSSRRIIIPNKVEESGSRRRRTGRGWLVAWVIRIITPHSIHLPVQPEDIKGKKQRRVEVRIVISVSAPTNTRTMAVQSNNSSFFLTKSASPAIFPWSSSSSWKKKMMNPASVVNVASSSSSSTLTNVWLGHKDRIDGGFGGRSKVRLAFALGGSSSSSSNSNISSSNSRGGGGTDGSNKNKGPAGVPSSNYVVPLDKSLSSSYLSSIMRPLAEILRDLNKRIPDNIIKPSPSVPHQSHSSTTPVIPWYHANRMLSFYAPGWCGEVRDVIFSEDGSVTVVYRVTIRGSDGEAHRESSGTISSSDVHSVDPVAAAEEIAFCRACARFGLGLYMYHEE